MAIAQIGQHHCPKITKMGYLTKNHTTVIFVTSSRAISDHIPNMKGHKKSRSGGVRTMTARRFSLKAIDVLAVMVGIAFAAPFVLVIAAPFVTGL